MRTFVIPGEMRLCTSMSGMKGSILTKWKGLKKELIKLLLVKALSGEMNNGIRKQMELI